MKIYEIQYKSDVREFIISTNIIDVIKYWFYELQDTMADIDELISELSDIEEVPQVQWPQMRFKDEDGTYINFEEFAKNHTSGETTLICSTEY